MSPGLCYHVQSVLPLEKNDQTWSISAEVHFWHLADASPVRSPMELDLPSTQFTGPGAQVSGFCILTAVPMSPKLVGSYFHLPERKPHPLATAADDPQPIPRKPLIYSLSSQICQFWAFWTHRIMGCVAPASSFLHWAPCSQGGTMSWHPTSISFPFVARSYSRIAVPGRVLWDTHFPFSWEYS